MSEPKRYERCYHKDYIPEGMEEHYNGKWVKWEDYARLKAEVERLQSIHSIDSIGIEQLKAEVERLSKKEDYHHDLLNRYALDDMRLQAQVERLTKAGDAIYQSFDQFGQVDATTLKGWQAAKEGKQS